ncbi:MAG: DeoR/GlpR family DNA-binding transcription regulator [Pseudomonadota bacterium]
MTKLDETLSARQEAIIQLVETTGFATIAELAARFDVTTQTIRRDVNALCVSQVLARFHGGVGLPNSVQNEDYKDRQTVLPSAKNEIGRLVGALIPHQASLFMNIGTTTEAVAQHLLHHQGLRIVTNNLHIADMFSKAAGFEVMVAGGYVRGGDGGVVGEAAIDFLDGFKLDFGVIGISGIDPDGSLLDFDYREVRAAQAIIANARTTILVADHTKFGRAAMAKVASLDSVDILVTDRPVPPAFEEMVAAAGLEVVLPEPAGSRGTAGSS